MATCWPNKSKEGTLIKKFVIIDRDGCLNRVPTSSRYVENVLQFNLFDDVVQFIGNIFSLGIELSVVTNQQGIARGLYSILDVYEMHHKMTNVAGVSSTDIPIYICPHLEGTCVCRKPSPFLLERALSESGFQKTESIFIGDQITDYECARSAQVDFVYLDREEKYLVNDVNVKRITNLTWSQIEKVIA